jgi:hypothetical protein
LHKGCHGQGIKKKKIAHDFRGVEEKEEKKGI